MVRPLLALLLLSSTANADVVRPPPPSCPRGFEPATDHGGPYCRPPPPTKCPAGHVPRVVGRNAYCEPPPKEPCAPGSEWTSLSREDTFCLAQPSCAERSCGADASCVPTSFCLSWTCFRCSMNRVVGACRAGADCRDGVACSREYRCDPRKKRVAPGRAAAPPRRVPDARLASLPKREPASCSYQDCPRGLGCAPLALCVEQTDSGSAPQPGVTAVVGSCSDGRACPAKSVCSRRFRCVDPRLVKPASGGKPP